MYPVNQVILGGDSMFNSLDDIDMQILKMEAYRKKLQQLKNAQTLPQQKVKLIWDDIDAELLPMTDEQRARLLNDSDYVETYTKIQTMVLNEILNLVKGRIEGTTEGKELLLHQLKTVKKLKGKIIDDTNREMQLFMKFKEYSKSNPEVTYEEFIKNNI